MDVKISALPASAGASLVDLAAIVDDPSGTPATQKATLQQLFDIDPWFKKVGTAYVGGDQTGNARGASAIDIQATRSGVTEVASGLTSTAIGNLNKATDDFASAFGYGNEATKDGASAFGFRNTASNYNTAAFGFRNTASGVYSAAFGYLTTASGYAALSFGFRAQARINFCTNVCGPLINRKDDGESSNTAFRSFCGAEVVLVSKEVDLETVGDETITLPAGCHFFPNEVGVWVTSLAALVTQPTVRFGWTGTEAGLIAAVITTALTATFKRERKTSLLDFSGQTSLVGGVTSGANAGTLLGRFYFKGMLIEDE